MRTTFHGLITILAGVTIMSSGCSVNVGGTQPDGLVTVTARSIPAGQALAFQFTPEAGRMVTVSVQANTDLADPDFHVVRGQVDYADLESVPFGNVVLIGTGDDAGQEIGSFTPEVSETYTLFVTDPRDTAGATFSVTVTQE